MVLLSFIFSQAVTSQFELRWCRCMLIWLYPENCVSYIQPDTLRRTHTIKPTPFPLDLFLFLLLLLLKTLPLKLFFVLWFFSSYTASCQHLSQSYRFIWWEQKPENHWHVSDTEEYCDCFSFTAMKKSWESLLTSVWTQRFKQCLKKKSRTECRHKKHITLTKHQHMQLTITWFMKKTMSLYTVALSAITTVATASQLGQYH